MVLDNQDFSTPIQITGSSVTLNIAIASSAVTLNVAIQSSAVTLNVNLTSSSITLNVNIASSAATLNINLTSSSITLNINFTSQTTDVNDAGSYQTFAGNQLFFGATTVQAQGAFVNNINLTPAGAPKFYLQGFSVAIQSLIQNEFIIARITVGGTVVCYITGAYGDKVVFNQPLPVGVGVQMNLDCYIQTPGAGNVTCLSSIWGYYR